MRGAATATRPSWRSRCPLASPAAAHALALQPSRARTTLLLRPTLLLPAAPRPTLPAAQRPNTGHSGTMLWGEPIDKGYRRASDEEAEREWRFW